MIGGSGFGVKSPAAPLVRDTFENGVVGDRIETMPAVVGTWDTGAGSEYVTCADTVRYAGGKSALHSFAAHWNASLAKNAVAFPVLYVEFRRYYPGSNGYPSNYKPWRFYDDNDALQFMMGFGCTYQVVSILDSAAVNQTDWTAEGLAGNMDTWQHYQILYRESAVNSDDGALITWRNGVKDGIENSGIKTRSTDVYLEEIRIGHYFDVGPRDGCDPADTAVVYTDNVYIDTTWARVEIGNAPTYAGSTHREIQIPTMWTDGAIAVTVNTGRFAFGQNAYLFVIDDAGIPSHGTAVTIDGAPADTVPPVLSNGLPSGSLQAGTASTTLQVTTDEPATCRWSQAIGTSYASMTDTFTVTGGTSHQSSMDNLSQGASYTYYVRCMDGNGNAGTTDYEISWSVTADSNSGGTAENSGSGGCFIATLR